MVLIYLNGDHLQHKLSLYLSLLNITLSPRSPNQPPTLFLPSSYALYLPARFWKLSPHGRLVWGSSLQTSPQNLAVLSPNRAIS